MKKLLGFILSASILMSSTVLANNDIKVYYNNVEIELTNKPVKEEYVTMLPLREVCEALGHSVEWISEEKIIKITQNFDNDLYPTAEQNETTIYNKLNTNKCHFDMFSKTGGYYRECFDFEISSPSMQINGTTYLPKDFFMYMLGDNIEETENSIYIVPNVIKTDFSKYDKVCLFSKNNFKEVNIEITNNSDIDTLKSILTTRAIKGASKSTFTEYGNKKGIEFINTTTNEKETVYLPNVKEDKYSTYLQLNLGPYYIEIDENDEETFFSILDKYYSSYNYSTGGIIENNLSEYDNIYAINNENKTEITNSNEKEILRNILSQEAYKQSGIPECGFSMTNAVEFVKSSTNESIIICPALDSCGLFRINDSNYYVETTLEEKAQFVTILNNYGLKFF